MKLLTVQGRSSNDPHNVELGPPFVQVLHKYSPNMGMSDAEITQLMQATIASTKEALTQKLRAGLVSAYEYTWWCVDLAATTVQVIDQCRGQAEVKKRTLVNTDVQQPMTFKSFEIDASLYNALFSTQNV